MLANLCFPNGKLKGEVTRKKKDSQWLLQPPKFPRKTHRRRRWREIGEVEMRERVKNYGLALCLFVFLFVLIGGGLHLNPSGAFLAAVTGTPLVIYAFHNGFHPASSRHNLRSDPAKCEASHVSSTSSKSD